MMGARPTSRLVFAVLASAGFLGCGEADPPARPAGRPTNQELFAERISSGGQGVDPATEREAIADFRKVWAKHNPVFRSRFLGVRTLQNPLDAWVVQEIIVEVAPDFVVEAGTAYGGSALLWALLLEQVNPEGRVITIDIEDQRSRRAAEHPLAKSRVDFLLGSSTDPAIVEEVRRRVQGGKVLVLLDSLHTKEHVADELAAYAPMVSVGSYVIVQDTPVGPIHAIREFVAANDAFEVDRSRERFRLTNTVEGYLRRVR